MAEYTFLHNLDFFYYFVLEIKKFTGLPFSWTSQLLATFTNRRTFILWIGPNVVILIEKYARRRIQAPPRRWHIGTLTFFHCSHKANLAYPMMNFILPLRAVSTRMGTSWGSRGPKIPWGRIATVRKSFSLLHACKTIYSVGNKK